MPYAPSGGGGGGGGKKMMILQMEEVKNCQLDMAFSSMVASNAKESCHLLVIAGRNT
jgi:hypothetical protein